MPAGTRDPRVGDRVRSFDFARPGTDDGRDLEGERACYMEGVVEAIVREDGHGVRFPDCDRYRIRVDRIVFAGHEQTPESPMWAYRFPPGEDPLVFPPVNGTPTMGGTCDGVEVIGKVVWR